MATITTPDCMVCEAPSVLKVSDEELRAYSSGAKVQDAFPTRDDDFREHIITGTHPECWKQMGEPFEDDLYTDYDYADEPPF